MTKTYPRRQCWRCGKHITTAGFARAAHEKARAAKPPTPPTPKATGE